MSVLDSIYTLRQSHKKAIGVLIDPDKAGKRHIQSICKGCTDHKVDYLLVGSSLLLNGDQDSTILEIKEHCSIPVLIFPGSTFQVSKYADAILFLSLISGRNPEYLIGKQLEAAPLVRKAELESIPTGYMLIDSGVPTTANYITNTQPIPHDKADVASCTAMAGELLGHKLLYLDGGSGAKNHIDPKMISMVKASCSLPLIVGGGIRNASVAEGLWRAGADMIVIGTALEKTENDFSLLSDLSTSKLKLNEGS